MRCQTMAGRAAKSPPDWLLYLPPDPSLPWALAGEEQGKIYTWLGVRTGKHAGTRAPGVWPGHSGPPLLHLPQGWKVPQPMGQPRWQEDQRSLIVQPTESGTVAGNTCTSWNAAISLPHLFPSLGLNHSCLYDYTACGIVESAARHLARCCCQTCNAGTLPTAGGNATTHIPAQDSKLGHPWKMATAPAAAGHCQSMREHSSGAALFCHCLCTMGHPEWLSSVG